LTGTPKSRTVRKTPELNEADPVPYTLGQAAKATGKQKSTILEAVRKGRISAAKDDLGRYQIDPAELHRVYSPIVQTEREETPPTLYKTELLEEKIKYLEREMARLERQEADLREDRDHWRRQATSLLTDQRTKAEPPRAGLWQRLFGRK
jgi:chromosome segregation ATPase